MTAHIIWDVSPEIFDGFIVLRWYGVCWVLGALLGHRIMLHIYKSEDVPVIEVDKLTIYIMVGAIIGARFGHVLFYDPVYYFYNPIEILPVKIEPSFQFTGLAGLASHGGILGALLALYVYNRKFKKDYLWLLDRLTIAGAALGGFIRLGNLMNSEVIGTPSDLPWAFVFTSVDSIPRHPSQLYEAIFYFIVSVSLYFAWKSKRFNAAHGFIFGLGIALIFVQRFLIEFLKEDQVPFEESLVLNMGQALSIPMIVVGLVIMIWSKRNKMTTT
jgi:prolipoprotein diacylglyceryl transferase